VPSVLKAHRALRGAPRALAFSARATVCTTTSDAFCPALHLSGRPDGGEQKAKSTVPSSKDPGFTGPERLSSTKAPSARLREASRGARGLPRKASIEPLRIRLSRHPRLLYRSKEGVVCRSSISATVAAHEHGRGSPKP
jgi:hypothetical protein